MHAPSPLPVNRLLAWGLVVGLAVLCFWLLAPVLAPFVVAAVLAYALHPLVLRLQALHIPRALAVVFAETLALLALLGLLLLLVPVLMREWPLLRQQLPALLDHLNAALEPLLAQLGITLSLDLADLKGQLMAWLSDNREDWLMPLLASLKLGGSAALALLGYDTTDFPAALAAFRRRFRGLETPAASGGPATVGVVIGASTPGVDDDDRRILFDLVQQRLAR